VLRWRCVLAIGGLLVVLPTSAYARRAATFEQKSGIVAGFEQRTAHSDLSCYRVFISTADESWASLAFGALAPDESIEDFEARCPEAANGLAMMHRRGGSWGYEIDAGSDTSTCPLEPVPTRVALDLRACVRAYVYYGTSFLYRPRVLPVSAHAVLTRLRWRHWGRDAASAAATYDYVDAYAAFRVPVRVRASHLVWCGTKKVYERVRITPVTASHRDEVLRKGSGCGVE
jgi:hypothetical protein